MTVFTDFERDAEAVGVHFDDFITAIGIWVYANESSPQRATVTRAAEVFNTTTHIVVEAVLEHPWLAIADDGNTIESDGE